MALRIIACIVLGWFFGGWNGAILVSRAKMHEDVRAKGSGNAGLTNFLRSYGGAATLLVLLIDVGKTVAACLIATLILPQDKTFAKVLAGFAVQVGHIFPVFFGFHGGKGIACAGVVALITDWRIVVIAFPLFLIVFFATRYVSLASITGMLAMGVLFVVFHAGEPQVWSLGVAMAALAIFMHRSNIVRLVKGTERRTHFHRAKNEEEAK